MSTFAMASPSLLPPIGIARPPVTMPRNLSRLKFRVPKSPKPLDPSRISYPVRPAFERDVRKHVLHLSKPATSLGLYTVVDPRWKQQPGGKTKKLPFRPHTLRDLVDPRGRMKHGRIIYVFRNTKTNQVIYSLSEMLDNYHLGQLPFIGKHSKPPALRPDEWAPHCVVTFATSQQGLHAFRKLREFRRLHELSWDKTNPEWIRIKPEKRMAKIMDQVANTSADIAEVLTVQEQQAEWMQTSIAEHEQRAIEFMDKRWPEIDALANASLAKDKKDADNTKWLEHQIKSLKVQLGLKTNQNEADQKRVSRALRSHETRLKKILYAQRKSEQFKQVQEKLANEAELANEDGAEEKLERLRQDVSLLEEQLANPITARTAEEISFDSDTVRDYKKEIADIEAAFAAKKLADGRDHFVARSVLPPQLKKQLPKPFTMDVEIKWADLLDPEYAAGKWPAAISHDVLPLRALNESVRFMNAAQYQAAVDDEILDIVSSLDPDARRDDESSWEEPAPVTERKGIWKYLPKVGNPLKRAEA